MGRAIGIELRQDNMAWQRSKYAIEKPEKGLSTYVS